MASSFIANALQVNFESVLGISDNEGMELEQFFDTAFVQNSDVLCAVSEKYVAISETRFADVFNLPTDGLTDLSKVPNDLVLQARTLFSKSSVPVQFSCKKRLMKYEFRLLNDILAKSITVKTGLFDVVTHERFLLMTGIKAKTFPPLKILSAKTVNTYIATNKTIDARGESDEPEVAKVAFVKKKYETNQTLIFF
ncbi:RNA-dependent RNA polymerase 6 [Dorcoceras hygrometricum]|uniref:RNA-dependent RNA polymerase 6 n=1 Tax=Dorcoceras hygrometricum TaxID=472368 RepID=A0A2Z7BNP8_9LAMI|nr:RNA-dependent RNA polymerase 6 [Dorcoceras hygrometricum]